MNGPTRTLPDPRRQPTLSVVEASGLYDIGLRQTYEALRAGEIPGRKIGGGWVIPTAKVLEDLGLLDRTGTPA